MKNIFKSCVSLLLVLCMVVGFVPATMLTAHATETETQSEKETIVYASLGDSMTNGYCLFGYEGSSGGVNYGVETYANKFAAYLAGYDGAIANDQVIFEGDKAIVDHRPLAISGMRAQDIQWVLELEYTDDALMKAVFDMDYYDNQGWDASTWYDTWDFCGDYRTWADFCDFDFRYADAAAKILAMYNAKADTNGKYFLSSYADANAVENAKKGIAANPYYPEKEAQVGEIGDHKFLQIATEYFQESVTDADVISLAVGNTNFGTFMLTAIIDVVMSDDFGFDETYKIERVQAMAAADDFTKATVNAMIGSADYAEMRAACVALGGDDVAKQNQIGGIVDYCMTAYIVGYIGMLNQILELKFPAGSEDNATTSLDIIQVALMNAYDGGELKDEEGNVIPTMGDLVGLIYDPVNDMLKELPEKLMESKSDKDQERFAGVKFYFADVDSVECMVEVFGDDFYMDAENAFVKYPGLLTGTEEQQTYQANIGSVVRDRFVDEIVYGDMLFAKLGINIPDNQKATFYQNAVGYDMMAPKDKALFMINALSEAEAKAKAATEGADEATIAAAVKQATEAATDTVKSLALYLALENALIRAGTKNVTMHSLSNLGEIESAFGQETIAGMYAAIENAVKDPTKPYLMDTCKALAVVLEDTLEATLQSYKSNPDLSLDGDIEIAFDANIVIDPTLVKNLLMADMISDADQAAAARNTAATAIAHSAVKQIYVATVLLNVGKGLDTLFTTMGYGSKEGYYNYLAELEWAAEEHEEGEAYEPVETLDDAAMKKLAIAWADDASSETPYANLKSYINVINGLEPDSPASGMVVNMMLNAAGDKLELLNKFGTQLKTDEGVEAGMAEFAELTTIETTIANTINGNAALTMESAGQLASLLALPQTISDELINNTDIQGALTLNARCLLGTGAGGHPSAGGHNTLYDAIIAAYTDSCAQGHAYVEDGDEAWTWTEVEGGYTASVKLVCENNIEHTATVKADVQAEITDSTCTDVGKTVYTATAKVKKQTFTATKEVEIAVKKHDFDTAKLVFDEKSHWYKCKNCEAKTDEAEHKFTAAADKDSCTCGYNKNHVHSDPLTVVPAEPATCTEPGSKEYYKCDTCDTWFADKTGLVIISDHTSVVTPALKHNYKPAWAWAEDYSSATLTMVCQNDNSHTVNNLEVTVTPKNTPATCTDEGKTVYTATAEFEGQPVTDTKTVTIAPLKHSFTNYVPNKDEVCGKDGTKTATCDRDGCNETDTVNNDGSALEHIFENYVSNNDAACGKDGTKTAVCERANCDAKDTVADTGSALKHSFENYVSNNDATCEEDGTKTAVCERDGCNVTDTVVDQGSMLGHDYGAATYEWSADGKTCTATHICENDKSHVETAKATVTSTVKTPAECEEMGTTTYTAKFDVAWATTQ
ncbi:MAG: hypothetical protein IKB09_06630, partial [Oscillospiraceae bacterium]|nr:hypothetical protein [Oscillospiraceae bacterium]